MSSPTTEARTIVPLRELSAGDRELVGTKAANLGELLRAGFSVPHGFVVLDAADADVLEAARRLGDGPFAVRSSGVGEDLADASFAGQYETVLGVTGGAGLIAAINRVRASANNARVRHYRAERASSADEGLAVLLQRMLAPQAAGVALTANPVTGNRDEVVISAGRGLGERIVSGEAVGDEWIVDSTGATCRRSVENALTAEQALAIASLARRVEAHFGVPQDIEWAIENGQLYLLQARPMTALPEPAYWTPPAPGYWMRNLRLGEWLSDPMTPLFADWLLGRIECGFLVGMRETAGAAVPFQYAAIDGWYYTSAPSPGSIPRTFLRALIESRGKWLGCC